MKPLVFLLLLVLAGQAHAEAFFASVDRTRLSEGETVVLTLESTDPTRFGRPDLTPLEEDFEVLGSRQVNRLSSIGDTPRASTRWILTLQPRRRELQQQPMQLQQHNLYSRRGGSLRTVKVLLLRLRDFAAFAPGPCALRRFVGPGVAR